MLYAIKTILLLGIILMILVFAFGVHEFQILSSILVITIAYSVLNYKKVRRNLYLGRDLKRFFGFRALQICWGSSLIPFVLHSELYQNAKVLDYLIYVLILILLLITEGIEIKNN